MIEDIRLINKIVDRADEMNLLDYDKLSLNMDLTLANDTFNLRLEEFLNADKFNFVHDIMGIQRNIDRKKREFDGIFVPRYSS